MRSMLFAGALLALAAGSAARADTPPAPPGHAPGDPLESVNRGLFRFNRGLDRAIVRPAALGYKRILPSPVRAGIRNVLNNVDEPDTFINDILQAHFHQGGVTVMRFVVNSTIGVGGLFDVAGATGLPIHYSDFGQTLGRYGVGPGPYMYIPVLGPSDLRDGTGRIVDSFASILSLHDLHVPVGARIGIVVVDGLDTRAEFDGEIMTLRHTATDEYASQRSVYQQSRQAKITGEDAAIQQLPDFDAPAGDATPPQHGHNFRNVP